MPVFKYEKQLGYAGPPGFYQREGDDRCYQRVVAGFCPPSERAGAIVVVAEEMALRPPAHIFWIAEFQEYSLDRLFSAAVDMKLKYPVGEFYGRTSDDNFLRSLSHWNNTRTDEGLATFQISAAPNSDTGNISFHVNILRQRLSPANKTFWLGESEFLQPALQELPQSEVYNATDTGYPILAAVAYPVAALDVFQMEHTSEDDRRQFVDTEYDPLNYFNKEDF